jgi:hypothetical protein
MIAMPTIREVSAGLYGAWRFARLDSGALLWIDRSPEGVSRSFWAAMICYPGFIALLALRIPPLEWAEFGVPHILLVESIGYVCGWAALPLAALAICGWLGREQGGFNFIATYNWAQILETGLFLLVAVFGALHIVPDDTADLMSAIALLLVLLYEWFIARIAVGAGGIVAAALVLTDLVLCAVLSRVTQGLY